MMLANPKKAVGVILSRVSPSVDPKKEMKQESKSLIEKILAAKMGGGEGGESEVDPSDALKVAANAFIDAIGSKDAAKAAAAFKEMFKACENSPDEEYEDEGDEELGFDTY